MPRRGLLTRRTCSSCAIQRSMMLRELSVEWSSTTITSIDASVACEHTDARAASSEAASLRTGMMIETSGRALIQIPPNIPLVSPRAAIPVASGGRPCCACRRADPFPSPPCTPSPRPPAQAPVVHQRQALPLFLLGTPPADPNFAHPRGVVLELEGSRFGPLELLDHQDILVAINGNAGPLAHLVDPGVVVPTDRSGREPLAVAGIAKLGFCQHGYPCSGTF